MPGLEVHLPGSCLQRREKLQSEHCGHMATGYDTAISAGKRFRHLRKEAAVSAACGATHTVLRQLKRCWALVFHVCGQLRCTSFSLQITFHAQLFSPCLAVPLA